MCLRGVVDCIIDFNYSLLCHSIILLLSLMVGGGFCSLDFGLGRMTFFGQGNISGSDSSRPTRLEMALSSRACLLVILPLSWEECVLGSCSLSTKPQDESQREDLNMICILKPSQAESRQDQLNLNQSSDLRMRKVNICVSAMEIFEVICYTAVADYYKRENKKNIFAWCSNYILSDSC